MKITWLKSNTVIPIIGLIMMALFYQPNPACGAPILSTDKDIYNYSEMIKVNFSNSPGNEGDWICIVSAGSPDTEGGDYKYMPKGLSRGDLTFDPPKPGKYEARAYYNYSRNGYVVSGRYAFSVVSSPEGEAAMAQRMERKIDPNNPLEAGLPSGHGLVYIFREGMPVFVDLESPIKADGKPIATILDSSYFPFSVPAGDVNFTARECKATIKVKPNYVYYLKLRVIPTLTWVIYLDHVPHQEGANIIESYKLTQLKK